MNADLQQFGDQQASGEFGLRLTILVDTDLDGVWDHVDNCVIVPNSDQYDSNGDGIGSLCDGDITGPGGLEDCVVNFVDLQAVKDAFFSNPASPVARPAYTSAMPPLAMRNSGS